MPKTTSKQTIAKMKIGEWDNRRSCKTRVEEFCGAQRPPRAQLIMRDAIQDVEISTLKEKLGRLERFVATILARINPDDIVAAIELKTITEPTHIQLEGLGPGGQPAGLDD